MIKNKYKTKKTLKHPLINKLTGTTTFIITTEQCQLTKCETFGKFIRLIHWVIGISKTIMEQW